MRVLRIADNEDDAQFIREMLAERNRPLAMRSRGVKCVRRAPCRGGQDPLGDSQMTHQQISGTKGNNIDGHWGKAHTRTNHDHG